MPRFPFLAKASPPFPPPHDGERAARALDDLKKAAARQGDEVGEKIRTLTDDETARALLASAFGNSPYLARMAVKEPAHLAGLFAASPDDAFGALEDEARAAARAESRNEIMTALRGVKRRAALTIALADIAGAWTLEDVTGALARLADACLTAALRFLLWEAARAGRFAPADEDAPETGSAIAILAMGKYGAGELNYSSDIDIVVVFERDDVPVTGKTDARAFAIALTRDIVKLIGEVTGEGYVFRVDLRLRPDAGATAVALSMEAAEAYYEQMGQNWERAAFIKARARAGDIAAGEGFLKRLEPFIWRRYLDFAAIEDVHSIKRQIHAKGGSKPIAVEGHNVKLGRGGIREIEFFVQTQQLIAGGRDRSLRGDTTLGALRALRRRGMISAQAAREMSAAYRFLRMVEHRLQMIEDAQTHTMPGTPEGVDQVARFCGFAETAAFRRTLLRHMRRVTHHYGALFESAPPLAEERGSLVFTGVENDPDTVETLAGMGFERAADIAATIRAWHHGRLRATRSSRARENLTTLMPLLLRTLANTPNPDQAFFRFHDFLSGLPAGVQFFALLHAHPELLRLLAETLGAAPRLATYLARNAGVIDALLDPDFLDLPPETGEWRAALARTVARADHFEEALDLARRFVKEQSFRIGLQVLRGTLGASLAGAAYADLAEAAIAALMLPVEAELARRHGRVAGGGFAVVALGKLGGREMTATSDLDLIFIYDHEEGAARSDGPAPLDATTWFARLGQRLINALTAATAEGRLYAVDMRLRPSGNAGPLAARLEGFARYQAEDAWTWEHLALTRARVIAAVGPGGASLADAARATLGAALRQPRDAAKTRRDVHEMRARLKRERAAGGEVAGEGVWNLKHAPGGLMDAEFIAQGLQLIHAADTPTILAANTREALSRLEAAGVIGREAGETLAQAVRLYQNLTQVLAIAIEGRFEPATASPALLARLAEAGEMADFSALEARLAATQQAVGTLFTDLLGPDDSA